MNYHQQIEGMYLFSGFGDSRVGLGQGSGRRVGWNGEPKAGVGRMAVK